MFDSEEAPSRSIFQHTFRAFLELRGYPIPVFEADWHGFQVDAYYADHRLIIELDGYRDHRFPTGSRPTANVTSSRSRCARDAADHLETTDPQAR